MKADCVVPCGCVQGGKQFEWASKAKWGMIYGLLGCVKKGSTSFAWTAGCLE